MSDMYAIKGSTLTAMGDVIRDKRNGTSELPILNVENVRIGYNTAYPYELPNYVKKVRINGFVKFLNGEGTFTPYEAWGAHGLGVAPGSFGNTNHREVRADENYNIVWNGYSAGEKDVPKIVDFETEIEGNKWAFVTARFNGSPQEFNIYFTAIGLDENGNEFKYTPLEMVEKINEMDVIPPSAFNITGDCQYKFYAGGWDWFIDSVGDKVITSDINNMLNMFNGTKVKTIPFDINAKSNNQIDMDYMFNDAENLEYVPRVYNVKPSMLTHLFDGCKSLREIPEDWCDTWDWSYIKGLTSSTYGKMGYMLYACYSLRKAPYCLYQGINPASRYSESIYYQNYYYCSVIDEITNLPMPYNTAWTSNGFNGFCSACYRLKEITFALQEDGTPYVMNWKKQTIDLSQYVGYANVASNVVRLNSGITADKEVVDDATYQALKNDEDWFSCDINYSRYNHTSAVNTINTLPDTSVAGGGNIIKFKGASGALTDGGAINTLTEEEIAVATAKGWTVTLV